MLARRLLFMGILLMLLPLAHAQDADESGRTSFTLYAHAQGDRYWWSLDGDDARNPTLVVAPNETITVRVLNVDDAVHNLVVEELGRSDYVDDAGEQTKVTFTAPAEGVFDYYCEPHRAYGMRGLVRVAGTPAPDDEIPAPAFALVVGAWALAAGFSSIRRRG